MPYELGGRADKSGNKFEILCVIYQFLKVIEEKIDYVILEALGEDEKGTDIWIGHKNGEKESQQFKGRNGSKNVWDFGTANAKSIFVNWKYHLDRDKLNTVTLVTPIPFPMLQDLIDRANNTSNNPRDFYDFQIKENSKEFIRFFDNYSRVMEINPQKNMDLLRCVDYLRRTKILLRADSLEEQISDKINYLFIGDEKDIYDTFIAWIVDGNILGKEINQSVVYQFLREKNLKLKNLALDNRIVPRLKALNQEYKSMFIPLRNGMIKRSEFNDCRDAIEAGESIIIHGKAGRGKSGCAEAIVDYCEEKAIPYVAIKLDKRSPNRNAEKWGHDLGFPASIAHCLHSISKDERSVVVLDQLDALRWTQSHSKDALLVCAEIINQIARINLERKHKISIIFVCRSYDLENDASIQGLFRTDDEKSNRIIWRKIQVNELNEDTIRLIIGEQYEKLTNKLREILKIPSNLYIWQQLEAGKEYSECSTTSNLIAKWWDQSLKKFSELKLNESDLNKTKEELIKLFEQMGRLYVPKPILNSNQSCLDFLRSAGFLIIQDNKVAFTHQSILDSFLSEKMLSNYYNGEDIIEIIGNKEKQTPGRRYQVQMLMQNLIDLDSQDFLEVGQKLLASEKIRYSFKFIYFEILNQLDVIDDNIKNFVINNCEDETNGIHIINDVIIYKPQYVRLLRESGILDRWFNISDKIDIVFRLLSSMSPKYEKMDADFIEKHSFLSREVDFKFANCFLDDISQDIEEMFELRLKFYKHYPELFDTHLDIKTMIEKCEIRLIRVIVFILESKNNSNLRNNSTYDEEILYEDALLFRENSLDVINLLLPLIPIESENVWHLNNWSGRYAQIIDIERTCIQIIKKANASLIKLNPQLFWESYQEYMGMGYYVFNEIILDGLYQLPEIYSDDIINYLCNDFDKNIFDETSGNGDKLLLVKLVLGKYGKTCSRIIFNKLEKTVIKYLSPDAKELYQRRINCNREKNGYVVFWSFWGDLQKEILETLPNERLSNEAKNLIGVLKRRFPTGAERYKYSKGHGGFVSSSVSGEKLSNKNWLKILTNKKINEKDHYHSKEVPGGFIESSVEQFTRSFSNAVSEDPERMIKLVLYRSEDILEVYIDALFSGIAYSKSLNNIPVDLLEEMILKYPCDNISNRANSICSIIEKSETGRWSPVIFSIIKDIAVNHKNPEIERPNVTKIEDTEMASFDMLHSNAINCVRGNAASAIGQLLWKDKLLLEVFRDTIEKLVSDENPAVKLASLFALWPSYNIDREWASERIIGLFEKDYRLVGIHDSKDMVFLLYPKYRERILKIIKCAYNSEDDDLIRIGATCMAEMFILKNEFRDEISNVDVMSKIQAESILSMVVIYFNKDEYNELIKNIFRNFMMSTLDLAMPYSRLFIDDLINLKKDKDFLIEIMTSNLSSKLVYTFVNYLEKEAKSIIDYKDIIIALSHNVIDANCNNYKKHSAIGDKVSKLIIGLYDETSSSTVSEIKNIANECLDIWDLMFEKQIGSVRMLSREIMER